MGNNVTGYQKQSIYVIDENTHKVSFYDSSPNYFRITNNNSDYPIYFSTSYTGDGSNDYDMKINPGESGVWVDPIGRYEIYLSNPLNTIINIKLISFNFDYNPVVLALSDKEIKKKLNYISGTYTIGVTLPLAIYNGVKLNYIINDGANNMTVKLKAVGATPIILKPGEAINNIDIPLDMINIIGTAGDTARYLYIEEE